MTVRARRLSIVEQEAQQAELLGALQAIDTPSALQLAEMLARCRASREKLRSGNDQPGLLALLSKNGRYRCRHAACWSCRPRLIRGLARKQAPRFGNTDNRFCSLVTIADSMTAELSRMHARVIGIRRGLRDRRNRTARTRVPWRTVEAIGHVEPDPYLTHDIQQLAPEQAALVRMLPVLAHGGSGRMWIVRAHLAVRHEGIGHDELLEVLALQFPGVGRVHVQPFHENRPAQENAGYVIGYGIKHEQRYDVGSLSEAWPVAWKAEYWAWLHGIRRRLQPLRISLGPQRPTQTVILGHQGFQSQILGPVSNWV
jgi:hypothetical protein